ncbi:MAG: hypothetical protein WCD70_08855 [Alphaproteobacteria bacterium]
MIPHQTSAPVTAFLKIRSYLRAIPIAHKRICWDGKNNFFKCVGMLVLGLMFCAHPFAAQADEPMPDAAGKPTTQQQPDTTQCRGSSDLTQDELLSMLHAIVEHGDLNDKPFIEKTLKTKLEFFQPAHGLVEFDGLQIYKGGGIHSGHTLILFQIQTTSRGVFIGELKLGIFDAHSSFDETSFHDCGPLTKKQLDQSWGGLLKALITAKPQTFRVHVRHSLCRIKGGPCRCI